MSALAAPAMSAEHHLTIRNDLGELGRVQEWARERLAGPEVSETQRFLAQLALEEALSNVIRHGYDEPGAHEISVRLAVDARAVAIEIVDDGREFDPRLAAPVDVLAPLERRPVGGLGVHLLRSLLAEVRYERRDERNHLSLRF